MTSPLAGAGDADGRGRRSAPAAAWQVEVDERWIELDYGEFDGRPLGDVPAETWAAWRSDVDLGARRAASRSPRSARGCGPPARTLAAEAATATSSS